MDEFDLGNQFSGQYQEGQVPVRKGGSVAGLIASGLLGLGAAQTLPYAKYAPYAFRKMSKVGKTAKAYTTKAGATVKRFLPKRIRVKDLGLAKHLFKGKTIKASHFGLKALGVAGALSGAIMGGMLIKEMFTSAAGVSKELAEASRYMPRFLEQKTAFIRNMLNNKVEFSGDTSAVRYAGTERARANQAIQQAYATITDRRFVGQEARYYSQY